jgi:hypothetical protein
LLDVGSGPSKTINEKVSQPLLRSRQIARGIEGPQNVVARNLPVERRHQTLESLMADGGIDFSFFH